MNTIPIQKTLLQELQEALIMLLNNTVEYIDSPIEDYRNRYYFTVRLKGQIDRLLGVDSNDYCK